MEPHSGTHKIVVIVVVIGCCLLPPIIALFGCHMAIQQLALGQLAYEAGDYLTALDHHATAVTIVPNNADFQLAYGQVLFTTGQYGKAIGVLTEAIRLNPYVASAYQVRSRLYQHIGAEDLAIADSRKSDGPNALLLPNPEVPGTRATANLPVELYSEQFRILARTCTRLTRQIP